MCSLLPTEHWGLVAITASCHAVTIMEAVIIGAIGSCVVMFVDNLLERNKIDDVVGAIPVHLGAGIWELSQSPYSPTRKFWEQVSLQTSNWLLN